MGRMPIKRYLPDSALAAVTWALRFLVPGWLLGHAYDAVAAVANRLALAIGGLAVVLALAWAARSEEHTSELKSLMRISYAVVCLTKKYSIPIILQPSRHKSSISKQSHACIIRINT